MVVQQKNLFRTENRENFNNLQEQRKVGKLYSIEYREYMDSFYYKGWFEGLVPKWSEWKAYASFDDLKRLTTVMDNLNHNKSYLTVKREYRIVKNVRD